MSVDFVKDKPIDTYCNDSKATNNSSNNAKTVEQSFQNALNTYTTYVKDRLKNGDPKFQIGGAEMTEKEWHNLICKVDASIDAIKEELEKRLEVLKEREKEEKQAKKKNEQKKIIEKAEKEKEEKEILEKTMAELSRISIMQKVSIQREAAYEEQTKNEQYNENAMLNVHEIIEATDEQIKKLLEDQ